MYKVKKARPTIEIIVRTNQVLVYYKMIKVTIFRLYYSHSHGAKLSQEGKLKVIVLTLSSADKIGCLGLLMFFLRRLRTEQNSVS